MQVLDFCAMGRLTLRSTERVDTQLRFVRYRRGPPVS